MERSSVIGGTVVDVIYGAPLKAAEVSVQDLRASGQTIAQPASTRTDNNGRFRIEGLGSGRYLVQASRDGYINEIRQHETLGTEVLLLSPGQHVEDLVLRLLPGGAVSGRVVNERGIPLSGVTLQALTYSHRDGRQELEEVSSTSSDSRGRYRMQGLAGGEYYIRGTSPNPAQSNPSAVRASTPIYYPAASNLTRAAQLSIRPGTELAGIDLTCAPEPTFEISGRVLDAPTSLPARAVEVTLLSDQGDTISASERTSADGEFKFSGIVPGSYVLVVESAGDARQQGTLWGRTSVDVRDVNVEGIEIILSRGAAVSGHIRVEGKTSLDLGELTATLEAKESMTLSALMPGIEDAPVTSDGSFILRNVATGTYELSVFPIPAGYFLEAGGGLGSLETSVTVAGSYPLPSLELILRSASAWIDGTVSSDKPAARAFVVLAPQGERHNHARYYKTAVTNPFGKFVIRSVPPGDYKLFAWESIETGAYLDPDFLRGYEDRGQDLHVEDGAHVDVQIEIIRTSVSP
jgi:5-hydroxyisourate hydrolase-like protein (transthyretin family)